MPPPFYFYSLASHILEKTISHDYGRLGTIAITKDLSFVFQKKNISIFVDFIKTHHNHFQIYLSAHTQMSKWFSKSKRHPLFLCQLKETLKQLRDNLKSDEDEAVYFQLTQQLKWISALEIDISSVTDPSWTFAQEIEFTEECSDPEGELSRFNQPSTRMIRLEQMLDFDSHFIKQPVYQQIRSLVLNLKQSKTTVDQPEKLISNLKRKLTKYLRKRHRLSPSQTLDLVVDHYIQTRIGILCV